MRVEQRRGPGVSVRRGRPAGCRTRTACEEPCVQGRRYHRRLCSELALIAILLVIGMPQGSGAVADEGDATKTVEFAPPGPKDWPSFRNGNAQRGIAGSELPENLELLWKREVPYGCTASSSAAIVGGRVYVGTLNGNLHCLDRRTGKTVWTYRSIDDPDPETFAPGFKAGPLVTAESIYIGDEDGIFHAVDRATGDKQWRFETGALIAGCASMLGDRLFVGSHDSFLYCLNKNDGSLVWKFQTDDRVNCSPAISGNYTFVAGCDHHLRVIDIETGEQRSDIPLGAYLIASPALVDEMLYVGNANSEVVALDWKQEEFVWRYKDRTRQFRYHASAAVTDKFVVVGGHDKRIHCIDRQTGDRVWTLTTQAQVNSSPVVVGDRVFCGSDDGNIYGLRLKDGQQTWKYNTLQDVTASPAVGQGCLVIGTEAREAAIYCFGAKGQ